MPWTVKTVTVPRAWVGNVPKRHLSRSRTYLIAGAFAPALTAFIATRTLVGSGGPTEENPGGGGGNQQPFNSSTFSSRVRRVPFGLLCLGASSSPAGRGPAAGI